MNDTPTFIDKTIDNYNNELTKACLREQLLKEDCQDLERELTAARAELAEMTARAASLAAHLPPDTLCGDIQKWRDEYKMDIEQRDRLQKIVDEQCRVSSVCREYREQRDRLAEALQLFLNRVQYTSVFMDGKLRGGTFNYRSSGFDDEVTQAYEALAAVKGDKV